MNSIQEKTILVQQLEWSKTLLDGEAVTLSEAEEAVAKLGEGWRLPTRQELESLLDLSRHDPAIDTSKYPDTKSCAYWTSTPVAGHEDAARWAVYFCDGSVSGYSRRGSAFVRAVRDVEEAKVMSEFVWPSDEHRAENREIDYVCDYLEDTLDNLDALRATNSDLRDRYESAMVELEKARARVAELERDAEELRSDARAALNRDQGGRGAEAVSVDLKEYWQKLQALVDDYVSGYEFRGEGDYTPNEKEQSLIEDCIDGLLHELSAEGYLNEPSHPQPQAAMSKLEWSLAIDRIVPDLSPEPDQNEYPAEWSVWADRQRVRRELSLLSAPPSAMVMINEKPIQRQPSYGGFNMEDQVIEKIIDDKRAAKVAWNKYGCQLLTLNNGRQWSGAAIYSVEVAEAAIEVLKAYVKQQKGANNGGSGVSNHE